MSPPTNVQNAVTRVLPDRVKSWANPLYLRYLSRRADHRHQPATTTLTEDVNAEHVLLVVIDALRLDATPDLPFEWSAGVAPSTWTFPSITSIHTGSFPHEHGSVARTDPDDDVYAMPEQSSCSVLPQVFERAGFDTYTGLAFLTPFLAVETWYENHRVFPDVRAEHVLEEYLRWREGRPRTFAYLHLGDLHAPLNPPTRYIEAADVDMSLPNLRKIAEYTDDFDGSSTCQYYKEQRMALYQAARSYLEDVLEEHLLTVAGDTIILVTGDHGEAHWEHVDIDRSMTDSRPNYGVGHGGTPLDAVARVPIAVSTPDGNVPINGGMPSLCDIPRTLIDLAGRDDCVDIAGHSWRDPIPEDTIAVCEAPRYGVERKAAYRGTEKVIESEADGVVLGASTNAFDLGERFGTLDAATIEELRSVFVWTEDTKRSDTGRYVQEQLEALGYT